MLGGGVNVWFSMIGNSSADSPIKTQRKSPKIYDDDETVDYTNKMKLQSLIKSLLDNVEDNQVMLLHWKLVLSDVWTNEYKAEYISNWYTHEHNITKIPIKEIIPPTAVDVEIIAL